MNGDRNKNSRVLLAHGDGGLLTRQLVEEIFLKHFNNPLLRELADAAIFFNSGERTALTTDSFVVNPLFFPGGDIGKLAACGTVNDLSVSGARPLHIAASFIIEEGLPIADLEKVVISMAAACREAGVSVIAGDTKVVPRQQADKLFITTSGVGTIPPERETACRHPQPGDAVIVNGSLGDHGLTILTAREDLGLQTSVQSDCAPLNNLIESLREHCPGVRMMRDLTRGGLATAAVEIARECNLDIHLRESLLPIDREVRGGTELLGLDPLYLANEGKFMAVIAAGEAGRAVELLQQHPYGVNARVIGEVRAGRGRVQLGTMLGGTKLLDLLAGDPLPRIC